MWSDRCFCWQKNAAICLGTRQWLSHSNAFQFFSIEISLNDDTFIKIQCWFHLLIIKVQKSVHISCQPIALYYFVVITSSFLHIMFEIIFSKSTSRDFIFTFQIIVHQKSILAVVRSFMLLDIIIHIQRIDSTLIRDQRTVRSDQSSPISGAWFLENWNTYRKIKLIFSSFLHLLTIGSYLNTVLYRQRIIN